MEELKKAVAYLCNFGVYDSYLTQEQCDVCGEDITDGGHHYLTFRISNMEKHLLNKHEITKDLKRDDILLLYTTVRSREKSEKSKKERKQEKIRRGRSRNQDRTSKKEKTVFPGEREK